jgi:hypothetical protein
LNHPRRFGKDAIWQAVGVREVKEKAAKLVAQGQLERAEVLLRQVLTQVPRDAQTWLKHAEVLKRLARPGDAVASYRLAARILDDEGHHPRAVAALKLALALLPDDVDLITDIIRSEMKTRKGEAAVRSVFPISSPSQLLGGSPRPSSPSAIARDAEGVQLALPPAPASEAEVPTGASPAGVSGAPDPLAATEGPLQVPASASTSTVADGGDDRLPRPHNEPDHEGNPGAATNGATAENVDDVGASAHPVDADSLGGTACSPEQPGGTSAAPSAGVARVVDPAAPSPEGLALSASVTAGERSMAPRHDLDASAPPAAVSSAPIADAPAENPASAESGVWLEVGAEPDAWPQVRRLSAQAVAIRASPTARWVVVSGDLLEVRFVDQLDVPDEAEWLE